MATFPEHDEIVDAFRRVAPDASVDCQRDNLEAGYTHIHGPRNPPKSGAKRCTKHAAVVHKDDGSVYLRAPSGEQLEGNPRAGKVGKFTHGWSFAQIRERWPTLDDFARAVIETACQNGQW